MGRGRFRLRGLVGNVFAALIILPLLAVPHVLTFSQQTTAFPLRGKTIVLDPGHGGGDPGAVGNFLRESDINLRTAFYLRELLESAGAVVIMTRAADFGLSLAERVELVRKVMPDIFVSIHYNATEDRASDYVLTFFAPDAADYSRNLAQFLLEEFRAVTQLTGYAGPGSYYVLRNSPVPAVLGEPCHISFPPREEWLGREENLRAIATAYFNAILRLFQSEIPVILAGDLPSGPVTDWKIALPFKGELREVYARIDNTPAKVTLEAGRIEIAIPSNVAPGSRHLTVYGVSSAGIFSNKLSVPFNFAPIPDQVSIQVHPSLAPRLVGSYYVVRASATAKGFPLNLPLTVSVDRGFFSQRGEEIVVPYMGFDVVNLTISGPGFSTEVHLRFEGESPVEVVKLFDRDSGELIGVVEKLGERVTVALEGYEFVEYVNPLTVPVTFTELRLAKTRLGILKDKILLIAFKNLSEQDASVLTSFVETVRPLVKEVRTIEVKSKREELELVRQAPRIDVLIYKNVDVSQLKVRKVELSDVDGTIESILRELAK